MKMIELKQEIDCNKQIKIDDLFQIQYSDIPDDGFSSRVIDQLPPRQNFLSSFIILVSLLIGIFLMVFILGDVSLTELFELMMPIMDGSPVSLFTRTICYLTLLSFPVVIGYVLFLVNEE